MTTHDRDKIIAAAKEEGFSVIPVTGSIYLIDGYKEAICTLVVSRLEDNRMTFDEWWEDFVAEHDEWKYADSAALRRAAFQAGAASRDTEIARLKAIPVRYRRLAFNAQLQDEIAELEQENDQLRAQIKQKDAEIAELVAALEAVIPEVAGGNAGLIAYNKCKAALAKVRKP